MFNVRLYLRRGGGREGVIQTIRFWEEDEDNHCYFNTEI